MNLKQAVRNVFSRAGYEIVPCWRMPGLPHAKKLASLFHQFGVRYALDVGANEGQFRDFLRHHVGFAGPIHSFEPIPTLSKKLMQRSSDDPSWYVHPFALGEEKGERELNIMRTTAYSSFLEPLHAVVRDRATGNSVAQKQLVPVETLDGFSTRSLQPEILPHVFLKLDTQGFDLKVLAGGQSLIAKISILQIEVSLRPLYDDMPNMYESISTLGQFGFAVSDLFLIGDDPERRAVEFDCIMVREPTITT